MGRLKAFVELARPASVVLAVLGVLVAMIVSKAPLFTLRVTLPALLCVACITAAGNVVNDYFDLGIDRVNKPARPLPSGRASMKSAKILTIILFTLGVLSSLFLPFLCILIACVNTFLLVFYSYVFKRSGFLGNVFVSCMIGSLFVFGAATNNNLLVGAFMAITAFFISAAIEVLKDMEDVRGDKAGGAKTLPVDRGEKKTRVIVASLLVLAILFSPLPHLVNLFSTYYLLFILFADLLFIRVIISVANKSRVKAGRNARIVSIGFNIAMIAFLAGLVPW